MFWGTVFKTLLSVGFHDIMKLIAKRSEVQSYAQEPAEKLYRLGRNITIKFYAIYAKHKLLWSPQNISDMPEKHSSVSKRVTK